MGRSRRTARAPAPRGARGRRAVVATVAIAGMAAGGLLWLRSRPSPIRREGGLHVLLITIDTLRSDALGSYGQRRETSPWIDRLAGSGVRFETAHAHNVMTLASHANILSGRYPFDHGVRDNAGFRFPETVETLATLLRARGYQTAAFVSGFPLDSRFGLDRGFELYDDAFVGRRGAGVPELPERRASETVARARAWLSGPGEAPRFCWLHLYDPHAPYVPPEPWATRFRDQPYLGEVAATDAALGDLLQPLLAGGRAGRTLVVLTADHGEALGDHRERTHGLFAYEATLRVPLVLFAPRLLAPRVVRTPARHVDLLPTVLDALGLPSPSDLPGRSLLGAATGHALAPATSYFEALSAMLGRGWAPLYGLLDGGLKYVDLPLPELYDLERDPEEARNLVASHPRDRERLQARLARLRAADRGPERRDESADTRERLAALGYVTAAASPLRERYTEADDPKRLVHLDDKMQQVVARWREGDVEVARRLCAEVLAERPDMGGALQVLARLERQVDRLDAAIGALERALGLDPEDPSAVATLAAYLGEAGRARDALEWLAPLVERPDPPPDVLSAQAMTLARLGRTREALAAFSAAFERDPSDPLPLVQMATLHIGARAGARAEPLLEQALRLDPELALAHHHLGLLRLARGEATGAEQAFRRALELDPTDVDSRLNLGLSLARRGRVGEARPLLETALLQAPRSVYGAQLDEVRVWLERTADPAAR